MIRMIPYHSLGSEILCTENSAFFHKRDALFSLFFASPYHPPPGMWGHFPAETNKCVILYSFSDKNWIHFCS